MLHLIFKLEIPSILLTDSGNNLLDWDNELNMFPNLDTALMPLQVVGVEIESTAGSSHHLFMLLEVFIHQFLHLPSYAVTGIPGNNLFADMPPPGGRHPHPMMFIVTQRNR
uniref:Uncharacterized protein n=1 Tax=Plectus sambesii TaxID=2011161 RepID=A0A914WPN3_9BILA